MHNVKPKTKTVTKTENNLQAPTLLLDSVKFYFHLFALCSSLAGCQFCYSIQFSCGTPLFYDRLKVPASTISIILAVSGPVSGFIVQPVIGALSDRSTSKFGRRRPFIFVGTICCSVGMLLISVCDLLGGLVGDNNDGQTAGEHTFGIIFAILGLFCMNIFVNVIQGPGRALISDLLPIERQQIGNASVSGVMGLSAVVANIVGAQFFNLENPYRFLFLIGIAAVVLCSCLTLKVGKEQQYSLPENAVDTTIRGIFIDIYRGFRYMPHKMYIVVAVFFLSWCAYAPFMIYTTQFFAVNIYKGSTTYAPELYNKGVMMGMYALSVFAAVKWAYSFVLPFVVQFIGVNWAYLSAQLLATVVFIMFMFFEKIAISFALVALVGINFATLNSIPFGLLKGITGNSDSAGLYMGVLNSASVIAQAFSELLSGVLTKLLPKLELSYDIVTNESTSTETEIIENVGWSILIGGFFSIPGVILSYFLKESNKRPKKYTQVIEMVDLSEQSEQL